MCPQALANVLVVPPDALLPLVNGSLRMGHKVGGAGAAHKPWGGPHMAEAATRLSASVAQS